MVFTNSIFFMNRAMMLLCRGLHILSSVRSLTRKCVSNCINQKLLSLSVQLKANLHGAKFITQLTQEQQVAVRNDGIDRKQTLGHQCRIQEMPILPLEIFLIVETDACVSRHPEHESKNEERALGDLVTVPTDTEKSLGTCNRIKVYVQVCTYNYMYS